MKKIVLTLIFLLVISFIVVLIVTRHNDERQIHGYLISLAAMLSKSINGGGIVALAEIHRIGAFFTDDCRIVVGDSIPEIHGREALIATIYQIRKMVADEVEVAFHDVSITIRKNKVTAISIKTAVVTHASAREIRDIEMHWEKIEERWKIAEAKAIPILY